MPASPASSPQVSSRHPAGLWVLFTTEMWERFAFYGMRALLVLYLVAASTRESAAGFGWTEADAFRLYAIYTSWVYLFPLVGGWVADRWMGQHRAVLLGAVLMALGQFALAAAEFVRLGGGVRVTMDTDPTALWTFYAGLALMVVGNGFFKPCISVMVGQLYQQGDPRRDAGFSIFYMGINIGAFIAPLVAGTVGENFGYHLGFMISGLGMILGLCTYLLLRPRFIPNLGMPHRDLSEGETHSEETRTAMERLAYEKTRPLTKVDYDKMFVVLILSIFSIGFWVAFEQAGSSLNTFAKDKTDRGVSESIVQMVPDSVRHIVFLPPEDDKTRWTFPASWYQSVNPLGIVLFAPFFAVMWVALARRGIEPSTPVKFGMGLLLLSVGFFMMVPGAIDAKHTDGCSQPYWLIICYCFCTLGELCISPVGLSMVTKLAPARLASLFMGVWFLCSAVAYYLAGYMAAILGSDDGGDKFTLIFGQAGGMADFFVVLGVIPAVIGILALALAPTIKRKMHGIN